MTIKYVAPVIVAVAAVVLAGLSVLALRLHRRFRVRMERERATGNRTLRNRMLFYVGRTTDELGQVARAETMRGWVWIAMTRHAPDPYKVRIGWAPCRWLARRSLDRYRSHEAGRVSWLMILVVAIGIGLVVDPGFTVHTLRSLLHAIVHIGHRIGAYLNS